jgi:cytoskeletal protein RodZ
MSGSLSWTSSLGDAYFNSPQNVMNAVQVMRQRAYQAGNLKNTPQQNVTVQNQAPSSAPVQSSAEVQQGASEGGQTTVVQAPPQTIVIQPSQPDVVYVPQYNPTVVYGAPVAPYPG